MYRHLKPAIAAAAAIAALAIPAAAVAAETLEVVSGDRKVTIAAADPIGQSFTAFTDTISAIGFQFSTLNPSRPNTTLAFSLYAGETLSGSSLFSQSFVLPDSIQTRDDVEWVDIALPDLAVTNGGIYTAVLSATSNRAALVTGPDYNIFNGEPLGPDAYLGGKLLTNWSSIYPNCRTADSDCDANFRVTGDLVGGAVPEPATWALMMLGLAAVGGAMRRRPTAKPALA